MIACGAGTLSTASLSRLSLQYDLLASLPGLTRQSIFFESVSLSGWMRESSSAKTRFCPRMTNELPDATASLRRLCVFSDRRARAHQIGVAIDIVGPAHRTPIFIHARYARRKTALGAAIGAGPSVVGDVVHGVRRVAQR